MGLLNNIRGFHSDADRLRALQSIEAASFEPHQLLHVFHAFESASKKADAVCALQAHTVVLDCKQASDVLSNMPIQYWWRAWSCMRLPLCTLSVISHQTRKFAVQFSGQGLPISTLSQYLAAWWPSGKGTAR